jgi:hypothetical protein
VVALVVIRPLRKPELEQAVETPVAG